MKEAQNTTTVVDTKLLEQILADVKVAVNSAIEKEIIAKNFDETTLIETARSIAREIVRRTIQKAIETGEAIEACEITFKDTADEFNAKWARGHADSAPIIAALGQAELMMPKLKALLSPYLKDEIPYLVALKLLINASSSAAPSSIGLLNEVKAHVEALKTEGKENTFFLRLALQKTTLLLKNELSPSEYKIYGKIMRGHSSPGLKALGLLMLALSVVFAATGAGLLIAGATGLVGLGVFAINRPTNLSRAMNRLANNKVETDPAPGSAQLAV